MAGMPRRRWELQREEERDFMHQQWSNAEQRANYAETHPWRNLWARMKRKLRRE